MIQSNLHNALVCVCVYDPSQFNLTHFFRREKRKVLVLLDQVLSKKIRLQQFLESGY